MTGAYTIGEYDSVTCCVTPVRGGLAADWVAVYILSMKHLGVEEEEEVEEEPEEDVEGEKDAAAENVKAQK